MRDAAAALRQNRAMNSSTALRHWVLGGLLAGLAVVCNAAPPGPGDVPPPMLGLTHDGARVQVPDFAGKVVVVTFWATWCPYCLKELPVLENVQNKVGKDHIEVIAVNTENRETYRAAWRLLNPTLHLALLHDADGAAQETYGVKSLPHMVIIGRDGHIVRVWHGYSADALPAICDDLNRALAAPV